MLLDSHAIARTIVATVGAGAAGYFSGYPLVAGTSISFISNIVSELLSQYQSPNASTLSTAFEKAVYDLVGSMGESPNGFDTSAALTAISRAIAYTDEKTLRDLLVANPEKATVSALLDDALLTQSQRSLAESYLAQALSLWQRHLAVDASTIQAFRILLCDLQQRISSLETAGLDLEIYEPYVHGEVAPSFLFRPTSKVLTLIGRNSEIIELQEWCSSNIEFTAQALAAAGGTGKTRLALHLMEILQQQGWFAALVKHTHTSSNIINAPLPNNILLILDYADYRGDDLKSIITTAKALVDKGKKVRLLLLARPDASWWEKAKRLLNNAFYKQCKLQPPQLVPLCSPKASDSDIAAAVLQQVARHTPYTLPSDHSEFLLPANGTPLMWMMAAYCFVQPNRLLVSDKISELCDSIVMLHECEYLSRKLKDDSLVDASLQALTLFTLAGGVDSLDDPRACDELLRRVPLLESAEQTTLDWMKNTLASVYPNNNGIDALRPDLLGEWLVSKHTDNNICVALISWISYQVKHAESSIKKTNALLPLANALAISNSAQDWFDTALYKTLRSSLKNVSAKDLLILSEADSHGHPLLLSLNNKISGYLLARLSELSQEDRSHALNNASVDCIKIGDLQSAIKLAYESLAETEAAMALSNEGDNYHLHISKSRTQKNISTWLLDASRRPTSRDISVALELSKDSYEIACEIFNKTKRSDHLQVMTSCELAYALSNKFSGDYETAIHLYNQTIRTMEIVASDNRVTDPEFTIYLSDAYSGRGRRLYEMNVQSCLEDISKSISLRRPIAKKYGGGQLRELAHTLQIRADILKKKGEILLAKSDAKEAYNIRESMYIIEPSAALKFFFHSSKRQCVEFGI